METEEFDEKVDKEGEGDVDEGQIEREFDSGDGEEQSDQTGAEQGGG
jgi:hypothetical protein